MSRTQPWEVSDRLWARVEPLLPVREGKQKVGRPAKSDRQMLGAILYVLRTGIPWNALPREIGASTTVYDRFRWWEQTGVFKRLWEAGLTECDEVIGLDWAYLSLDGSMTKAPFAVAATATQEGVGPNPTDRGKQGTKRSVLCDGHGLPLAVVIGGANTPDMKLAAPTLDALVVTRPAVSAQAPHGLCLDKGYDYDLVRYAATQRGYTLHLRTRSEERAAVASGDPEQRPRRWVVERLHSWLNRYRRLLVRFEKLARTYRAFVQFACALICFQQADRFAAA